MIGSGLEGLRSGNASADVGASTSTSSPYVTVAVSEICCDCIMRDALGLTALLSQVDRTMIFQSPLVEELREAEEELFALSVTVPISRRE